MLVSIQGIKGSYHHDVVCALYGDDVNILECLSFDKMAESVFESKAQIGIMAIENSIAGSIIPNYAIIDKLNLKISLQIPEMPLVVRLDKKILKRQQRYHLSILLMDLEILNQ